MFVRLHITMDHQDWTTVYTRPKGASRKNKAHSDESKTKGQAKSIGPKTSHKERALDSKIEEGSMKTKTFDADFRKKVQQYRLSQKLSQKALAQKVRVPEGTIRDLENGKLAYNGALVSKLKRIMGQNK